jgi:hypothetical protein
MAADFITSGLVEEHARPFDPARLLGGSAAGADRAAGEAP